MFLMRMLLAAKITFMLQQLKDASVEEYYSPCYFNVFSPFISCAVASVILIA